MSPRSPEQRLTDIREALEAIRAHRAKAAEAGLETSAQLLLDAVVRQLAIIGEATAHLPAEVTERHPAIPWRGVKGMRSWLDHACHRVDSDVVWRTVDEQLPALAEVIDDELRR